MQVNAYTSGRMTSGTLAHPGSLRDALEASNGLLLDGAMWQPLEAATAQSLGSLVIPIDDVLIAVADDDAEGPVHSAWHHVRLESGPYTVEGDLATMPGFDPGRALTRPSGEFVMLRDVRLSVRERPEAGVATGDHALVNRYTVERIQADLMLGFFFPGATVDATSEIGWVG